MMSPTYTQMIEAAAFSIKKAHLFQITWCHIFTVTAVKDLRSRMVLDLTLLVPPDFGGASEKCQGEF
jgi:hypothetical protein